MIVHMNYAIVSCVRKVSADWKKTYSHHRTEPLLSTAMSMYWRHVE